MVWQWVLRNWVRRVATEQVYKAATDAAQQHAARADGADEESGEPRECDLAFVFAMGSELGGLYDLVESPVRVAAHKFVVWHGTLAGRTCLLVQTGVGARAAASATQAVIAAHRPRWIVSAGFAGGLQASLKRNELVVADRIIDLHGGERDIDISALEATTIKQRGIHVGRLLTVDRIIRTPGEKQSLGEQHDALAVEMETYSVAAVCQAESAKFLSVRVISDAVDDELMPLVEQWTQQKSAAGKLGSVEGTLWNDPNSIKQMMALREQSLIASDRLAKFLVGLPSQLVSDSDETS